MDVLDWHEPSTLLVSVDLGEGAMVVQNDPQGPLNLLVGLAMMEVVAPLRSVRIATKKGAHFGPGEIRELAARSDRPPN